jgi:hypothetical protein
MASVDDPDLLIIARERVVVPRLPTSASVEIRLDSRRTERRRARGSGSSDDRRRSDRRAIDVTGELQTAGWAFITAARRRAAAVAWRVTPTPADDAEDQGATVATVLRHLGTAMLCASCIAGRCVFGVDRVERVLDRLQSTRELRMLGARCEECRRTTLVYTTSEQS